MLTGFSMQDKISIFTEYEYRITNKNSVNLTSSAASSQALLVFDYNQRSTNTYIITNRSFFCETWISIWYFKDLSTTKHACRVILLSVLIREDFDEQQDNIFRYSIDRNRYLNAPNVGIK